MMRTFTCLLVIAACGGDGDDSDVCVPDGNAQVSGEVMGRRYDGRHRARQVVTADSTPAGNAIGIVIDPDGTCTSAPPADSLLVEFCVAPTVGSYPIQGTLACPGNSAIVISQNATGNGEVEATSGSLEIESVTASCVRGSYMAMFGAEPQTVLFDATICP